MARIVTTENCIGCGICVDSCPQGAITLDGDTAVIAADQCIDCGICEDECPQGAIVAE